MENLIFCAVIFIDRNKKLKDFSNAPCLLDNGLVFSMTRQLLVDQTALVLLKPWLYCLFLQIIH